jgi:hypothetical protein
MVLTQNERMISGILFSIFGFFTFLGALRKWRWILNPEDPIAKYIGMDILRGFAFFLGVVCLAIGLSNLYWAFY